MQADDPLPYTSDTVALLQDDDSEAQSGWRSHRVRLAILAGVVALAVIYMVYARLPGQCPVLRNRR